MCKSNENTKTGGGKFSEIEEKVKDLVEAIDKVKGGSLILFASADAEGDEDGKQSTTAACGKKGAIIDMIAHSTAHEEGKEIARVITDGLMLGIALRLDK